MTERVVREVDNGEYSEGLPWEIVADALVYADTVRRCEHVARDPASRGSNTLTLPLGIKAVNEGGYNSTLVCAECIVQHLRVMGYKL